VSIMSSNGVPIQEISDTVGHKSTRVIVPAIRGGATVMDDVFADEGEEPGWALARFSSVSVLVGPILVGSLRSLCSS
jgi:hypothetical protein